MKAVLEEVLQEEMTKHLEAGYRELTPTRRGERNGHYTRNLLTPAAYASLLRGLLDRGLCGVLPVVSDDHEGIKTAVAGELPGAE